MHNDGMNGWMASSTKSRLASYSPLTIPPSTSNDCPVT